jgi:methionyl-tRNA formyltransferase
MAMNAKVSGYKDLFDLNVDAVKFRPQKYSLKTDFDYNFFQINNFDVLITLGWQRLIPEAIIKTLTIGGLTIHGSSQGLPKGRGRSPLNWALIEKAKQFKLSLLTLASGADSGKIIDTVEFDILPRDNIRTLYYKNAMASSAMLIENIPLLTPECGEEQNEPDATYYPKRSPEDGKIAWDCSGEDIEHLVRAVTKPYPGAFTYDNKGNKITIWDGQVFDTKLCSKLSPGKVVAVFPDNAFLVASLDVDFLISDYDGPTPLEGSLLE